MVSNKEDCNVESFTNKKLFFKFMEKINFESAENLPLI